MLVTLKARKCILGKNEKNAQENAKKENQTTKQYIFQKSERRIKGPVEKEIMKKK